MKEEKEGREGRENIPLALILQFDHFVIYRL